MNIPFQKSAEFYSIIYQNKDYQSESEYLYALLKDKNLKTKGSLLDIGCGTGGYIPWHLKNNMEVTGLDISGEMLSIARFKFPDLEFFKGDLCLLEIPKKFDFAFMMFHVIDYQTTNEKLIFSFKNIAKHLAKGGILLFDFWHGPAIENDPPIKVEKEFEKGKLKVVRKTTPSMDINKHLVNVCFDYSVFENGAPMATFQENHLLRYLFVDELTALLSQAGFEICLCNGWLKNIAISNKDWYGMMVARKL